ncbi:MAG: hypothetical protein ABI120_12915, partial [Gemmatimonadaceae bacterium]
HRLTGADSLLLEAYTDPKSPTGATPPLENMERVWTIAQRANSAELWYVAADNYMHNGLSLGYKDAMERALKGFKMAEAIDSSYVGGLEHQPMLYLIFGDSAAARAANRRQARIDSTGDFYIVGNAQLQVALAKASELPAIAHAIMGLPANAAVDVAMMLQSLSTIMQMSPGTAVVDSVLASEHIRSALIPGTYEAGALKDVYLNAGRIAESTRNFPSDTTVLESARAMLNALYWDADTASAARAAARIGRWQKANRDTTGNIANNLPRLAFALWSVEHGDTASARGVLNDFRAYRAPASNVSLGFTTTIYGKLLESRLAVTSHAANAKQLIDDANASVLATPRLNRRDVRSLANLMIAGMYEEVGDAEAALAASSRRDMQLAMPVYASTFLRLQADAAEKLGDRETAVRALRAYIELRAKADASLQPDVQAAKNRLKALEKKS